MEKQESAKQKQVQALVLAAATSAATFQKQGFYVQVRLSEQFRVSEDWTKISEKFRVQEVRTKILEKFRV